jgi:predicted ATPase
MISKLRVQNFKCLRDVTVELKPLTVLIGKNDTGKTSLLEAIENMAWLVGGNSPQALLLDRLVWQGADPPRIDWTVEVAPSPRNGLPAKATYSFGIAPTGSTAWESLDESVLIPGCDLSMKRSGNTVMMTEGEAGAAGQGGRLALSFAPADRRFLVLGNLQRALSSVTKYRFAPARLAEPNLYEERPRSPGELPHLDSDGRGLVLVLDYLLTEKRRLFDTIERELHEAVPFIKAIQPKQWRLPNAPSRAGRSLSFELASSESECDASSVSDGVLLFLGYLTLVHTPGSPSTLLIEEPENGIHPRQLQRIAEYLKYLADPARGASAVQIIAATHSPYLLDFVPPDSVLVFGRRPNGKTVVAPLLSLPGVRERLDSGFSLGEMWFNVGEDRLLAEVLK